MSNRILNGRVGDASVGWFRQKTPGSVSASFLNFTRNNRQIIAPVGLSVNHLFCYVQRRDVLNLQGETAVPLRLAHGR